MRVSDAPLPGSGSRPPRIVAIAASAGGLHALSVLLGDLPATLSVPVLVLQHLAPNSPSMLAELLARRTPLKVKQAQDGDELSAGTVYVAAPNYDLTVTSGGRLVLSQDRDARPRPSADRLFRSVAGAYDGTALVVVLSGTGRDGAEGVHAVKLEHGRVLVQEEAEFTGMPMAAISTGDADYVLPLEKIAPLIVRLVEVEEGK